MTLTLFLPLLLFQYREFVDRVAEISYSIQCIYDLIIIPSYKDCFMVKYQKKDVVICQKPP